MYESRRVKSQLRVVKGISESVSEKWQLKNSFALKTTLTVPSKYPSQLISCMFSVCVCVSTQWRDYVAPFTHLLQLSILLRLIVKRQNIPSKSTQRIRAKGHEGPERQQRHDLSPDLLANGNVAKPQSGVHGDQSHKEKSGFGSLGHGVLCGDVDGGKEM